MSLSPRNLRIDDSMMLAAALPDRNTSPNAASALSFQCQVSSNASICAALSLPVGPLNNTL